MDLHAQRAVCLTIVNPNNPDGHVFSRPQLLALHERITDADRALKSGGTGDVIMPVLIAAIAA